jgi:hypothetical protein
VIHQPANRYRIHGLLIESEIPLDAATEDRERNGEPDYRIVMAESREVPYARPAGRLLAEMRTDRFGYWACEDPRDPSRWTLRYGGVCDVTLDRKRRRIAVHGSPQADPGVIPLFVSGSVLAHVLTAEGQLVLHASAVELGGSALAIAGPSGTGKSTLAALLCAAGARLVSDDTLLVEARDGGAVCFPGSSCLRLRSKVATLAAGIEGAEVHETADGRTAVFPPSVVSSPLELGVVVISKPAHDARELKVERLGDMDGLLELLRSPRLSDWRASEPVGNLFELTAGVAESLAVFRATVPWGPPFTVGLGRQLLAAVGLIAEGDREAAP